MILSSMPAAAIWFFILAMPGIMPINPLMPPILAICKSCSRISDRSNWPLRILSAARAAFSASILAAAFSTSETMSPMPRMRPAIRAGWKSSSASVFSPVPISLIGFAGNARLESGAAPRPAAVDPRQHDAGEAHALIERACEIDRVLAGQGVRDQQHFMRIGGGFDRGRFRHHLFVERGAAGGGEQAAAMAAELAGFEGAPGDLRRLLAGHDRQGRNIEVTAKHRELLHGRRTIDV